LAAPADFDVDQVVIADPTHDLNFFRLATSEVSGGTLPLKVAFIKEFLW